MARQEVLIWPDPRLAQRSIPIDSFNQDLRMLVDDLLETMYAENGVGLAAPQIGVLQRLLVIDTHAGEDERPSGEPPLVIANPEFMSKEGTLIWEEGCLSVPGETADVKRASRVTVRYQDVNGEYHTMEAEDLLAVALQHESDHLDGILFVDHISRLKRDVIRRKMLKFKEERAETDAVDPG